jgi:hypothetical protein
MNHDTYLGVIFSTFNSTLKPNIFTAWGVEVCIFEIAGHYNEVIEGCNKEGKSDAIT